MGVETGTAHAVEHAIIPNFLGDIRKVTLGGDMEPADDDVMLLVPRKPLAQSQFC